MINIKLETIVMRQNLCEICSSPGMLRADRDQPLQEYMWLTGRKFPFSTEPEFTFIQAYPINSMKLCYYHHKVKRKLLQTYL